MNIKAYIKKEETAGDCYNQTLTVVGNIIKLHMEARIVNKTYTDDMVIDTSEYPVNQIFVIPLDEMARGYIPYIVNEKQMSHLGRFDSALRFYISPNRKTLVFHTMLPTVIKGVNDEDIIDIAKMGSKFDFRALIEQSFKDYEGYISHVQLNNAIDSNFSAACLDAQADIITKFLIAIIDKHPEFLSGEEFQEFRKFKNAYENISLLKISPYDKCIKAIKEKSVIRDMQKVYYEKKNV